MPGFFMSVRHGTILFYSYVIYVTRIQIEAKMSRKDTTSLLTSAVIYYFAHKRYSCHVEFGVESWGKKRIDVLALNTKGDLVGLEIKSCPSDFRTDKKWRDYLQYVNKMYMVFSESMWKNERFISKVKPALREAGVGLLVLSETTGYLQVKMNAKMREVDSNTKQHLVTKMAWRGGFSRHNVPKRKRLFLHDRTNGRTA